MMNEHFIKRVIKTLLEVQSTLPPLTSPRSTFRKPARERGGAAPTVSPRRTTGKLVHDPNTGGKKIAPKS